MPLPDNPGLALIGQPGAAPAPPTPGQRTVVADANYSAVATDRYIALTSITANRTITLPIPSAFPVGTLLVIQDESRSLRPSIALTIQGGGTINGLASLYIDQPNAALYLWSDGVAKWSAFALNLGKVVQALGDASTSLDAGVDTVILTAALTAPRVLTMQNLATGRYVAGQTVTVFDPAGFASSANTLSARRGGTNTINGATADVVILNAPRQKAELTVDNTGTNWGTTASASGGAAVVQQVGDTNATINAGTTVVLLTTALTAPRVLTLPAASGYTPGSGLMIIDPKGAVTGANTISIARAGADTINGGSANVLVLASQRGVSTVQLDSTGTNWGAQPGLTLRAGTFNDLALTFGAFNFGLTSYLTGTTPAILVQTGNNNAGPALCGAQSSSGGVGVCSNQQIWFGPGSDPTAQQTAIAQSAAGRLQINNGTVGTFRDLDLRSIFLDKTVTAGGTTGNQTINKAAGTVNIAAGNAAITVTNSLVVAGSIILCVIRTADATLTAIKSVVAAAGSFVITCNANATAETSIGFAIVA